MSYNNIKIGDVVIIINEEDKDWYRAIMQIDDIKDNVLRGFVKIPRTGNLYHKAKPTEVVKIGSVPPINTGNAA